MQKISQNGGMYMQMQRMMQQMIMLARMVDQARGTNISQQLASQFGANPSMMGGMDNGASAPADVKNTGALEEEVSGDESSVTKKARQKVAESTSPT